MTTSRGLDAIERVIRTEPQWVKIDGELFQAEVYHSDAVTDHPCRSIVNIAGATGVETLAE